MQSIHQLQWRSSYAIMSRMPAAMGLAFGVLCVGVLYAVEGAVKGLFGIHPERVM